MKKKYLGFALLKQNNIVRACRELTSRFSASSSSLSLRALSSESNDWRITRRIKCVSFGFTIVELMVVISIIGILATLVTINVTGAHKKARDTKRITDVDSIGKAMGLFNEENNRYPTEKGGWACKGEAVSPDDNCDNIVTDKQSWSFLSSELAPYLSPLPIDPLNAPGKRYYIDMRDDGLPGASVAKGAIIKTRLEANTNLMNNDSCTGAYNNPNYYDHIVGYYPNGVDVSGDSKCKWAADSYISDPDM